MKNVVFFTPNRGMKGAAEFISTALNSGGPARFNQVEFKFISGNETECARQYDTKYRAGHQSLLSIEAVQVCGDGEQAYFLRIVIRTESLRGSIKSSTMVSIPEKQNRFPEITDEWQEEMCQKLGHRSVQDLWDHLLDVGKIRRMPL